MEKKEILNMNLKKLCTTLAVFTLITSSCTFAQDLSEQELFDLEQQIIQKEDISKDENQQSVVIEEVNNQQQEVVEEVIVPVKIEQLKLSSWFINDIAKSDTYSNDLWVDRDEGTKLRIYLENNGNEPINFKIIHGRNAIRKSGILKPGRNYIFEVSEERSGRWTVKSDTSDGSKMNLKIKATS